jgi:hemerythrin
MPWQQQYSVGIPPIDVQHKQLFALLDQLQLEMAEGGAKDVQVNKDALAKILAELLRYTKAHFEAEEEFLQEKQYPGLAAHKLEHERLTTHVVRFQEDFVAGRKSLDMELLNFLRYWWSNHIMQTDKQYSAFLGLNAPSSLTHPE